MLPWYAFADGVLPDRWWEHDELTSVVSKWLGDQEQRRAKAEPKASPSPFYFAKTLEDRPRLVASDRERLRAAETQLRGRGLTELADELAEIVHRRWAGHRSPAPADDLEAEAFIRRHISDSAGPVIIVEVEEADMIEELEAGIRAAAGHLNGLAKPPRRT